MYSAAGFELTKGEYNYLLPPLRRKLTTRLEKHYIIANDIDDLEDILNRLKGHYDNYDDLKNMVVYNCSKDRSLKPFRDSIKI